MIKGPEHAKVTLTNVVTNNKPALNAEPRGEVVTSRNADQAPDVDEERLTPMDRMRNKIFRAYPDLAEFNRLHSKVLRTTEELEAFHRVLKDPELIASAKRELLADEGAFSDEAQMRRMCRVEFLDAALEWKDNPVRGELLETFGDVILAGNIKPEHSDELKHSLAGDKAELYISMLGSAPDEAAKLAAKAKGSPPEKIISYATLRHNAVKRNENIAN